MLSDSVDCVVTSPPYWGLRDYGHEGQLGLEQTPEAYTQAMVEVFREVRRIIKPSGTLWLNLGDSYAGSWGAQSRPNPGEQGSSTLQGGSMLSARQIAAAPHRTHTGSTKNTPGLKPKDLVGIPWRVAFALQADGWYLRQDIIWHKPNPMPESVTDRCTKAHEYLFLMAKSERYFYDHEAVKEPATGRDPGNKTHKHADRVAVEVAEGNHRERTKLGLATMGAVERRNRRDVWTIPTKPFKGAHFAVMPEALVEPCILAGCPVGGLVLDPFTGSGTVGAVAVRLGRRFVGCELNPDYAAMADERVKASDPLSGPLFNQGA
jgi:DNA modification methylase